MCLEKIREPTEEERSKTHIGYKIVKKTSTPTVFKSEYYEGEYTIGLETVSNRTESPITPKEKEYDYINEGIHFYTNQELKDYPFEKNDNYSLIEVEIQGSDLVAFGEGPCRCPCRCPRPSRYQAVATKVKVLREITEEDK